MKSLDAKKGEAKAEKAVAAAVKTEEKPAEEVKEVIDFSKVEIEPLFKDADRDHKPAAEKDDGH